MNSKIYQSQLLSELSKYLVDIKWNKKSINATLEKIESIGDVIFSYPLFEIYKKYYETDIGYYLLDTIISLDDKNEVWKILIEIVEKGYYVDFDDLMSVYGFFYRFWFINNGTVNTKCTDYIKWISSWTVSLDEYAFEYYFLEYIKEAQLLKEVDNELLSITKNKEISIGLRVECFNLWLSISPWERTDLIIDDYEYWLNLVSVEIVARMNIRWKWTKTEKLRKIILEYWDIHGKYVIENYLEKKKNWLTKQKLKKDSEDLENILFLVMDIVTLRQEINRLFFTKFQIKDFFTQDETIISEWRLAKNERELIAVFTRLRTFLNNFENLNDFITLPIEKKG